MKNDEKMHAVVARNIFRSQNVTKFLNVGPFLEVEMSQKCMPLWPEARLEVKMYKAPLCRGNFGSGDVEKVHAIVARSTFRGEKIESRRCSRHFWTFRCAFA